MTPYSYATKYPKTKSVFWNRVKGANRLNNTTVVALIKRFKTCIATGDANMRVNGIRSRYHAAGCPSYLRFRKRSITDKLSLATSHA